VALWLANSSSKSKTWRIKKEAFDTRYSFRKKYPRFYSIYNSNYRIITFQNSFYIFKIIFDFKISSENISTEYQNS